MAKVIHIDGEPHRRRRGKLVPIPPEWFGRTVSHQQKSRRHSKTRAKAIYGKMNRAQDEAALRQGDEPNPNSRKSLGCWHSTSGRVDKHRNKYRNQRRANHTSKEDEPTNQPPP